MSDDALKTAHNPDAPQDEQQDAMRQAQQAAKPSTVSDMTELVKYVAQQYEHQQENDFYKSLAKPNVIPFPSKNVTEKNRGMQSVFLDEERIHVFGDWYEKPGAFSFDMMRTMVDRTPILSAVIMTRQRQIKRFCRAADGNPGPGFEIRLRDHSDKLGDEERKSIQLLQGFFTNCGWEANPRKRKRLRRDNFSSFMAKVVRDSLVMDSAAIETEFKRNRSLGMDGFYAIDGSTIRLCSEDGYDGDDEIFALQVVEGRIRCAYTYDDLIYEPRNPRSDVLAGGYGMSETELLVNVVRGFLNAMTYNLDYFDKNSIPKGLLHLTGDYSSEDLSSFKRYWNAMVKGINNSWTLPVMVSKNQESKAAFENFGVDVNEIMFAKWMTFLTSIICSIYGMAPDEINFESFTAGTSTLSGSDTEEKLVNSKDKGLRPLLSSFEDLFTDYIVSDFGDRYVFRWTGLDEKSQDQMWEEEQTLLTFNEARKTRGWEEVKEDWGNAPINQTAMGAYMQGLQGEDDYGDPDAAPGDPDAAPGDPAKGKFGGDNNDEGQDGADEQDQGGDGDGAEADEDLQKSFGLPVFRVDP